MPQPTFTEAEAPACPICSGPVRGYESHTGFAYIPDHGGPFGGTGTILVAGGDESPAGFYYDRVEPQRWLSKIVLRPCGCALRMDGFKMYSRNGSDHIFRIEGEEFINPL